MPVWHARDFLAGQMRLLNGGTINLRRKNRAQCALIGVSCMCYLMPAVAFVQAGGPWNVVCGLWFLLVTCCSTLSDANLGVHPWTNTPPKNNAWAHHLDRIVATVAALMSMSSFAVRAPWVSPSRATLWNLYGKEVPILILTLAPLHWSRSVPRHDVWTWTLVHSLWHLVSASTAAFLCVYDPDAAAHPAPPS